MAVLKKIKFGTGAATPIAKTLLTAKSGGVMSVAAPDGVTNGIDENKDYQYELDVNVDNATIVKSSGSLAVGEVPAAQVSVADSGDKFTASNVEAALSELKDDIDNVVAQGTTYTVVDDTENVNDLPTNVLKRYRLQQTIGSKTPTLVGKPIDILKDNSLLAAKLSTMDATWSGSAIVDGQGEEALVLVYKDADGDAQVIAINVSSFLKEAEFGDGLQVTNGVVSAKLGQGLEFGGETGEGVKQSIKVKIDSTSSDAENFLSVGANGVKISGVQDAIDASINALDFTTDAAVAGQYISAIEETDGVVAVKARANVSDAVLTGYAKGSAPASGSEAVTASDDVKGAIAKLEHQVDAAKAAASAAHSKVEQATNTGTEHVTVTASQSDASGAITYTIGENDIASAQALANEITRAQSAETAIDSAVGLSKAVSGETRTFTPTTNYGTGSTTVMGNMQALDTQIKANEGAIDALEAKVGEIEYEVNGTELIFYGIPQHQAQQGG